MTVSCCLVKTHEQIVPSGRREKYRRHQADLRPGLADWTRCGNRSGFAYRRPAGISHREGYTQFFRYSGSRPLCRNLLPEEMPSLSASAPCSPPESTKAMRIMISLLTSAESTASEFFPERSAHVGTFSGRNRIADSGQAGTDASVFRQKLRQNFRYAGQTKRYLRHLQNCVPGSLDGLKIAVDCANGRFRNRK